MENTTNPQISTIELSIMTTFFVVLSCGIITGNGLIFAAYVLNRRLRSTTNKLILSLAASDFLVGLVSVPLWIYITFKTAHQVYSSALYQVYITCDIFVGLASILQLTTISIERCHAIVQPFRHRNLSKKKLRALIACPWLISCAMASLHPIQYHSWQKIYTLLMVCICFVAPLIIISLAYVVIYLYARSNHRQQLLRNTSRRRAYRRELRLSVTLALITFLFVIAWLPLFTLTIMATYFPATLPPLRTTDRLLQFAKWMHYSNSSINPFLYAFRNNAMRRTFRGIVSNVLCCRAFKREEGRGVRTGLESYQLRSSLNRSDVYQRWRIWTERS